MTIKRVFLFSKPSFRSRQAHHSAIENYPKKYRRYILAMVNISGNRSFLLPKVAYCCGTSALRYIWRVLHFAISLTDNLAWASCWVRNKQIVSGIIEKPFKSRTRRSTRHQKPARFSLLLFQHKTLLLPSHHWLLVPVSLVEPRS